MLKLQFLSQKWIQDLQLPLRHPNYAIQITKNYPLNNFQRILTKKIAIDANGPD